MAQTGGETFFGTASSLREHDAQANTWDAMESYFECITTCSLDDGECVTHCVEQLREHP